MSLNKDEFDLSQLLTTLTSKTRSLYSSRLDLLRVLQSDLIEAETSEGQIQFNSSNRASYPPKQHSSQESL